VKITRCWNGGSPCIQVWAENLEETLALFRVAYGCKTGYHHLAQKCLFFSGHAAVEFLKFHGQPLGDYATWVPKNDSRKYWRLPDAVFVEEARKYRTRDEWKRKANGQYQHVRRHRAALIETCLAHMVREGDPFGVGYQVYAYEFPDNAVYIGLTCNPKRRHRNHQVKGPVAIKIAAGFAPVFRVIGSKLTPTAAGNVEQETIVRYKAQGWTVLNRRAGGETGNIRTRYTYAKLVELARPFSHRAEFNERCDSGYQYACRHGLIDKIASELGWPEHVGHVWTRDLCWESAKVHKHVADWLAADKDAYLAAWRNGWLAEIKKKLFTKKYVISIWPREACERRARAFSSRSAWQYGCHDGSYVSARRKGWLKEIADGLYGRRRNRWSGRVVTA
jgi:hypothetical protein